MKGEVNPGNWSDYVNKWVLFKDVWGKWIFGVLREYNDETNLLKIQALDNGIYEYIEYQQASVIEAWVVKSWSKIL